MEFIAAAFVMGLVGSLHCLGMCGPIALALPLNRRSNWTMGEGVISYSLGRIVTYVSLGAILALGGEGLALFVQSQYVSLILGGVLMFGFIIYYMMPSFFMKMPSNVALNFIKEKLRKLFTKSGVKNLFTVGLLNGLLPCGLLYIALAGSLATGSLLNGMVFMAMFGLGTVPALSAVAFAPKWAGRKLNLNFNKIAPIAAFTLAILLMVRGLGLGIPYVSPKINKEQLMKEKGIESSKPEKHIDCCSSKH